MPSQQQNITQIPSNRVEIIDSKTGMVSREWYRFFLNLFNLAGSGGNQVSLDDLQLSPPPLPTTTIGGGGSGTVTSVDVSGGTTGLTTSGGPVTSSGTITLAGTLAVANGGTGATTAPSALTNLGAYPASNPSGYNTGTVTSVGGTGTVNGLTLTGTVTTTGNLTLGGTLDLSSPPTIGNTTPNTGKFTTLESTGTASLATGSTTSIQIVGDASYPQVKAVGGTNTPLVLQPLGTGALQAQKTDSSATGGNARGANAVDWQTIRSAATQVASGQYSVIGGGYGQTASNFESAVFSGQLNSVTSLAGCILGGQANLVSGSNSSIVGGSSNTTAGYYNFIGGGFTNSGTANGAVTTQSGTMNGTTAVTLSGSNASIKVGQYITGTSIAGDTYVAAISGTALTLSKNASGSSTSTLSFYTPHGVVVGGGNNQATGSYSFIGGGGDAGTAGNRNVASGDWSVVAGGIKGTASGNGSFIGGGGLDGSSAIQPNLASGICSVVVSGNNNQSTAFCSTVVNGGGNQATGLYSFVGSGNSNLATARASAIVAGYNGTTRGIVGNHIFPACVNPITTSNGISQAGLIVLARQTTDATATVLCSDANAASGTNQVILPNNSAYYFRGEVIAGVTGAGNTKSWTFEGTIKRGVGVGTTAIVGTPVLNTIAQDAGASAWTIALTADTTNGGLAITVTGQATTTIRWVAQVRTTEMTY